MLQWVNRLILACRCLGVMLLLMVASSQGLGDIVITNSNRSVAPGTQVWHVSTLLRVGIAGVGQLVVQNGARLINNYNTDIATFVGEQAVVIVQGSNSYLETSGLALGYSQPSTGIRTFTIRDGGEVVVTDGMFYNSNAQFNLNAGGKLSTNRLYINKPGDFTISSGATLAIGDQIRFNSLSDTLQVQGTLELMHTQVYPTRFLWSRSRANFASNSQLNFYITGNDNDIIYFEGGATIQDNATITVTANNPSKTSYKLMWTSGTKLTGRFSNVNWVGFNNTAVLPWRLVYTDTDMLVSQVRQNYASFATNPAARKVAAHLDSLQSSASAELQTQRSLLDSFTTPEQVSQAVKEITPSRSLFNKRLGLVNARQGRNALTVRSARLRSRQRSARQLQNQLAVNLKSDRQYYNQPEKRKLYMSDISDSFPPIEDEKSLWLNYRTRLWVETIGSNTKLNSRAGQAGLRNFSLGVMVGVDYKPTPQWTLGISAAFLSSRQRSLDSLSRGEGRTVCGYLYAWWDQTRTDGGGWYAEGLLGVDVSWYNDKRSIPTFNQRARSKYRSSDVLMRLGGGYDWRIGRWTLGITGASEYVYLKTNKYRENGAGALNMNFAASDINSFQTEIGGRIACEFEIRKVTIRPELHAEWIHEFGNSGNSLVRFSGGEYLRLQASELLKNFGNFGVSVEAHLTPASTIYSRYDCMVGSGADYVLHFLNVGFSYKF